MIMLIEDFLDYLLLKMGFGAKWRSWIFYCVRSASFSIFNQWMSC